MYLSQHLDGWMFKLFIDAQPQKGIQRLNDYKNTILHNELGWKKTERNSRLIGSVKRLV